MVSCASVGVDVITVHVNDVLIARADELRRGSLIQLKNRHTKVLAEPRRPRSLALHHRPVDDEGLFGLSSRKQDRRDAGE